MRKPLNRTSTNLHHPGSAFRFIRDNYSSLLCNRKRQQMSHELYKPDLRRTGGLWTYLKSSSCEVNAGTGDGLGLKPHEHVGPQAVVHVVPATQKVKDNIADVSLSSSLWQPHTSLFPGCIAFMIRFRRLMFSFVHSLPLLISHFWLPEHWQFFFFFTHTCRTDGSMFTLEWFTQLSVYKRLQRGRHPPPKKKGLIYCLHMQRA